jgi:hypothetical protein
VATASLKRQGSPMSPSPAKKPREEPGTSLASWKAQWESDTNGGTAAFFRSLEKSKLSAPGQLS